ncbi:MAG: PduL/EutD family phosphate acyltransferase [Anaerolineae bacterium]
MEVVSQQAVVKQNGSALNLEQMTREVVRRLLEQTNELEPALEPQLRNGFMELPVLMGVSVRHLHLCLEHIAILFGAGHDLQIFNELYQKGYYAAKEQVMVVGRKRCIEKVRVLGPPRPYSQVELAQTDALSIGLKLPVATEGTEPGTRPVTLVGPEGVVSLPGGAGGGAFIARRHIHLSDVTAAELGLKAGDLLSLRLNGPRPTTLHGVLVRVKPGWRTEVHVDTDEANACGIRNGQMGTLIIPRAR